MTLSDPAVSGYLDGVLSQACEWLHSGRLRRLVVVIAAVPSGEALERWAFDVETTNSNPSGAPSTSEAGADTAASAATYSNVDDGRTDDDVRKEIAALVRQITASVAFLPLLDEPCSFDVLAYADSRDLPGLPSLAVPVGWEDTGEREIDGRLRSEVPLRAFSTRGGGHAVRGSVAYRRDAAEVGAGDDMDLEG